MSDEGKPPLYSFSVGVVGDPDLIPPDELAAKLDLLVGRYQGLRRFTLLTFGGGIGKEWVRSHERTAILVGGDNEFKAWCSMAHMADALVVLARDPTPWRRLIALAEEAGVPVRVYTERPKPVRPSPPAWEVS